MTQQTYTPYWSKAPTDANWHWRDNDCPVLDHDAALDNWRDTLTVRPFQHRDIPQNLSDYFTGKTPFITAYVDLLLARMAYTQSFSGDIELVTFFEAFDVITFEDTGGRRKNYGVMAIQSPTPTGKICITHNIAKKDNEWVLLGSEEFGTREFNFRTITELEAVEFRKAMEAVYG